MVLSLILLCAIQLLEGSSPAQITLNNSSLSLTHANQCVTREEVKVEIQAQTEYLESQMQCTTREEVHAEISHLKTQIQNIQNEIQSLARQMHELVTNHPNGSFQNPARSCRDIQGTSSVSDYYWLLNTITGSAIRQYCDMTRRCCGSTGGWMQVANLDMTDTNQNCPSGFRTITSPRRMCGRYTRGCVSAIFPVHGVEYSRVCGRVIGYQYASPDAFEIYYVNRALTIDHTYVDGVSITHGRYPRKHIWTFVAAVDEFTSDRHRCPCTRTDHTFTGVIPPFVGNDYFCDTATPTAFSYRHYVEDPLWNGQGCGTTSSCCNFNSPPWFCKELPQATRDDIEVRICADSTISDEDTPVEVIELYVQ